MREVFPQYEGRDIDLDCNPYLTDLAIQASADGADAVNSPFLEESREEYDVCVLTIECIDEMKCLPIYGYAGRQ